MIGIVIGMFGAAAAVCAWIVSASFLYCLLSRHTDQFVFPFDQWLEVVPNWTINGWTKAYVVISAAVPLIIVFLLCRAHLGKLKQKAGLYGTTGWASDKNMQTSGIRSKRSPFV